MKNRRKATATETIKFVLAYIVEKLIVSAVIIGAFAIPVFALAQIVIKMYS